MNSVLNERLVAIGNAVRHAPHGQKESIYRTACEELQISRATLLRKLNETPGVNAVNSAATPAVRHCHAKKHW